MNMYRVASHVSSVSTKALCETKFKNWQERNRWLWWEEQTFVPQRIQISSSNTFRLVHLSSFACHTIERTLSGVLGIGTFLQVNLISIQDQEAKRKSKGLKVPRRKLKRNLINQHSEPFQSKDPSSSPSPSDCLSWSSSPSPSRLPQTPTTNSLLSTLSFRSSTILSCHSSQLVSKSLLLLSCHLKGQKV